jgi:hypothetical protein
LACLEEGSVSEFKLSSDTNVNVLCVDIMRGIEREKETKIVPTPKFIAIKLRRKKKRKNEH